MKFSIPLTALFALLPALAAPAKRSTSPLPFPDGFPNPSPDQIQQIQVAAHGTLSNAAPPPSLSDAGATALQLINFAENIEAVFFDQLLYNITNNVTGYSVPNGVDRQYVMDFIKVVKNTEELHTLSAGGALSHFGRNTIQPCGTYNFPVSNFAEAVGFASLITSNVFGVLGDVVNTFALNGDSGLVRVILQIAAAEGEQNGFFRYLLGKTPQELPFTTSSNYAFAFTALQSFVDVSSCPNLNEINLPTYQPLVIKTTATARSQNIQYAVPLSTYDWNTPLYIVYVNSLNTPVVLPLTYTNNDGTYAYLNGDFPYDQYLMNGLTVVATSECAGPFADIDEVAAKAKNAPGFILVN